MLEKFNGRVIELPEGCEICSDGGIDFIIYQDYVLYAIEGTDEFVSEDGERFESLADACEAIDEILDECSDDSL